MNEQAVVKKLLEHDDQFEEIKKGMRSLKNELLNHLDAQMVILS